VLLDIDLVITILSFVAIGYGVMVMSQKGIGNLMGGGVAVLAGLIAWNEKIFTPFVIGFVLMWGLKLAGFDKGK
jgi:xanthine/uracil permease